MIEVTQYKPVNKGAVLGTFSILFVKWKMYINELVLFQKNGRRWIGMPNRPYEKDNEKKYYPIVGFEDGPTFERFSQAILKALDAYFIKNQPTAHQASQQTTGGTSKCEIRPSENQQELPF